MNQSYLVKARQFAKELQLAHAAASPPLEKGRPSKGTGAAPEIASAHEDLKGSSHVRRGRLVTTMPLPSKAEVEAGALEWKREMERSILAGVRW